MSVVICNDIYIYIFNTNYIVGIIYIYCTFCTEELQGRSLGVNLLFSWYLLVLAVAMGSVVATETELKGMEELGERLKRAPWTTLNPYGVPYGL